MTPLYGLVFAILATVLCWAAVAVTRAARGWLDARGARLRADGDTVEIVRRRPLVDMAGHVVLVLMLAVPAAVLAGGGALPGPSGGGGNGLPRTGGTMTGQVVFDAVSVDMSTEAGGMLTMTPAISSATNGRVVIGTQLNQQVVSPLAFSGDVNNYAGCNNYGICLINSGGSARNVTGMTGGLAGDVVILCATNATGAMTLKHASGSSSAAHRFYFNSATDRVIAVEECFTVAYIYDGTNSYWREVK